MNVSDAAMSKEVETQRAYYAETASHYDEMHLHGDDEHSFALRFMVSTLESLGIRSVLDIGSGTGRVLLNIKADAPNISALGVEPSAELRQIGHAKGLSETELIDGDAMNLAFADGEFDLVCEFAVLHHVPVPAKAVSEMLRVARKAVFISDSNNFGHGSGKARMLKQALNAMGLWQLAYKIRTGGNGYLISEGDGLAYSYSVFDSL